MKSGRPVHTVFRIRRKDGAMRWLDLSSNFELARDDTPIRMLGVLADITERQADRREAARERRTISCFGGHGAGPDWISGTENFALSSTNRGSTLPDERWIRNWATDGRKAFTRRITIVPGYLCHVLQRARTIRDGVPFAGYDGEYRWMLDHGVPRFSPGGDFLGYVGSCIDITERKEMRRRCAQATAFPHDDLGDSKPPYEADADGNNTSPATSGSHTRV